MPDTPEHNDESIEIYNVGLTGTWSSNPGFAPTTSGLNSAQGQHPGSSGTISIRKVSRAQWAQMQKAAAASNTGKGTETTAGSQEGLGTPPTREERFDGTLTDYFSRLNASVAEEATGFMGGFTPADPGSNLLASMSEVLQGFLGGQNQAQLPLGPRISVPTAGPSPIAGFDPVVQSAFPRFNESQVTQKGVSALSSPYGPSDRGAPAVLSPQEYKGQGYYENIGLEELNPRPPAPGSRGGRSAKARLRRLPKSRSKKAPTGRRFSSRYGVRKI